MANFQIKNDLKLTPIEQIIKKLSKSQYETCKSRENPLVR